MNPYQVKSYIAGYNTNPDIYDDNTMSTVKEYADIYGIPFSHNKQSAQMAQKSSGVLSQLGSGFLEGFLGPLAFGGFAEEPEDETQSIANSMGHLLGFALPLGGLVAKGVGYTVKGVGAMASIGGKANIVSKPFTATGKFIEKAGDVMRQGSTVGSLTDKAGVFGKVPIKSIPLMGADKLQEIAQDKLRKTGWDIVTKHMNKGTGIGKAMNIGFQASHLAVASGISGSFNGENDELDNILYGAIAGGAFGGLGNFVTMGKLVRSPNMKVNAAGRKRLFKYAYEFADMNRSRILSAAGGSIFQGGMATMQGAPTATQIYEYILGGYFGFGAQGSSSFEANRYYNKFSKKDAEGKPRHTNEDFMDMMSREDFKDLSPEAQSLVRESHRRTIGEMLESREMSMGAGALKEYVQANLSLRGLDKISDPDKLKVEQLKTTDKSINEYMEQSMRNVFVEELTQQIREDRVTKEAKEITKLLTKEEIESVKQGKTEDLDTAIQIFFESKPFQEVKTSYNDIIRASESVSESQPEINFSTGLRNLINGLAKASEDVDLNSREVIDFSVNAFEKIRIADGDLDSQAYKQLIERKFPGLRIDPEMERGLGQLFTFLNQSNSRPRVTFDNESGDIRYVKGRNQLNQKVKTDVPKPADELIHENNGTWTGNVKVLEFAEYVDKSGKITQIKKPYDIKYNYETKQYESVMKPSEWISITKKLWNSKGDTDTKYGKRYLKIAKKDGGIEKIYNFHPKTVDTSLSEIFQTVAKKYNTTESELRKRYNFDRDIYYETMGMNRNEKIREALESPIRKKEVEFLDLVFQNSFKSNYLYESNWVFKDAASRVKRESLFSMNSFFEQDPKLYKDIAPDGKLNVYLVEDTAKLFGDNKHYNVKGKEPETYLVLDKNGKKKEVPWESKIDGWIVFHSELHKAFVKNNNLDPSTSHLKPAVAVEIDGGLFLVKGGNHTPRKAYDKAMGTPNGVIVVMSAAKSVPKSAQVYYGQAKYKGKYPAYEFKDFKGPSLQMNVKDFRITNGAYGDKHSLDATTIKKQMHSFFDGLTMSDAGYNSFMDAIVKVPVKGFSEEINQYVSNIKSDTKTDRPKNFSIDKIKDSDFVEIANDRTHPLHHDLMMEVFKGIRTLNSEELLPHDKQTIQELREHVNVIEEMYHYTNYDPTVSILNMGLFERAMHKYRLDRFTNPKWETSGSGWVAGVDPVMELVTGGIKKNASYEFFNSENKIETQEVGHVMLGESHKNLKIDWLNGKRTTLEKGYEEYLNLLEASGYNADVLARMRNKLMLAVMRVPANAVSGTRALLFDGFVKTGGEDFAVYMRGRDHFYIDGADVDGDKVFIYQGLPKEYIKDLVKNDSLLEKINEKGEKIAFENKAEKFNKTFGSELSNEVTQFGITEAEYVDNNPIAQWSPGALRKAGQSSYIGKMGMGQVVNAKSFLNVVLADIIQNNGNMLDVAVRNKKGEEIGRLKGETSLEHLNSPEGYYVTGVEASSRTADSASFFRMSNKEEIVNALFQSAFKNINFIPKDFKKGDIVQEADYNHLRYSAEYIQLADLNNKLYGFDYSSNTAYKTKDVQEAVRNFTPIENMKSSLFTIAEHMKKSELNIDPLQNFNLSRQEKNISYVVDKMLNNAEINEFVIRKNLFMKSIYQNIDYNELHKQMSKKFPEYRTEKGEPLRKVTENGNEKQAYRDFIWEGRKKTLPKDIQKYYESIHTYQQKDLAAPDRLITKHNADVERDFRINDIYDVWSAVTLTKTGEKLRVELELAGNDTRKRKTKPNREINQVALKIIRGQELNELDLNTQFRFKKDVQRRINELQKVEPQAGESYGIDFSKVGTQNEFSVLTREISTMSESIKRLFRKDHVNKTIPVYDNLASANKKIRKTAGLIVERANSLNIRPEVALDYFYTHLLSSIRPQITNLKRQKTFLNERLQEIQNDPYKEGEINSIKNMLESLDRNFNSTAIPRFTWQLSEIPKQVRAEFIKGFTNAFDLMNTKKVELKESEITPFKAVKTVEEVKPETPLEVKQLEDIQIDRLFDRTNVDVDQSKVPNDIKKEVLPNIVRTLKTLQNNGSDITNKIEEMYTVMKSEAGFTGTTSIKMATFQDLRNFDRFLKEILTNGHKNFDPKFYLRYNFLFPLTTGKRMNPTDMRNLMKVTVPVKNMDGTAGLSKIEVPMSSMTYLAEAHNNVRRIDDSVSNYMLENLFNEISTKSEIEALTDGVNKYQKLFEIAIKKGNADRFEKIDSRAKFYAEELASSQKDIDKYENQTYKITRDGKIIEVNGATLVKEIQQQIRTHFDSMYEGWIGIGKTNSKGVWTPTDLSPIYKKADAKKPVIIDDLIRYDKYGKFDFDNFYNKTIRKASEGDISFAKLLGNKNSTFGVDLINLVQREAIMEKKLNLIDSEVKRFFNRTKERSRMLNSMNDKTGRLKGFYFPQMHHNIDKLQPWIKKQQILLKKALENKILDVMPNNKGKLANVGDYKIPKRFDFTDNELRKIENELMRSKGLDDSYKLILQQKLARQNEAFQYLTSKGLENSLEYGETAMEFLNAEFRQKKKEEKNMEQAVVLKSSQSRGNEPMPFFSYSPDVITDYTKNYTSALFKGVNAMIGGRVIDNYLLKNPLPMEVKKGWAEHMRGFVAGQIGQAYTVPSSTIGLDKVQMYRAADYIDKHKNSNDPGAKEEVERYKRILEKDIAFKRKNGLEIYLADVAPTGILKSILKKTPILKNVSVPNIHFVLTDQYIVDWLNVKSQSLDKKLDIPMPSWYKRKFGTIDKPRLPFIGELPTAQKAREKILFKTLTNVGAFEAKMSLLSLLSHPKTALGNILGGSENTISNSGFRNFKKANDTKWLLTNVFKDAKLKDGTRITDRNTINRFISEAGALESFYVTEASMDKSLSAAKLGPFINEWGSILFKTKNATDKTWKEVAKKHKVWDSIVASGGYFMRVSETKLRADAFLAHYLNTREVLGQIIPNLAYDNPYLIKQALKGVEATQFLYHNVRRPQISTSVLGKVLTRFQPFAWNSISFRKQLYQRATRYGMTDKKSVDRLQRMMVQDLTILGLSNIFIASVFDSILPPPLSYLQDTTDWLFGDSEKREQAFFSAYPHPALAPLQAVTAPIHRLYMPALTAMINGDWDRYMSYYIHTMYPFGRLARSSYKTYQAPEMFPEFMLGIPVHKLGSKLRKTRKQNEKENES